MIPSRAITPEVFSSTFRDVIRVGFNWDRFFEESWPIEVMTLDSPSALARCFMPWYIGKTGNEVAYDDPEAVPMNLTDVPKTLGILGEERQNDIQEYADLFGKQTEIVEFIVPTYALPENQHFVLDRNHRLSALTMVSVPFVVTLWNVRGPLDSDCLLDLVHWCPNDELQ